MAPPILDHNLFHIALSEKHYCRENCPICWAFTLGSLQELLNGEIITLGSHVDFQTIASTGCYLGKVLCDSFLGDAARLGGAYPPDALVTLKSEFHDPKSNKPLSRIAIKIQERFSSFPRTGYVDIHSYSIPLGIYTLVPALADLVTNTVADPYVASPRVFDACRKWLSDCLDHHGDCPKQSTWMPTRVLYLGGKSTKFTQAVQLQLSAHKQEPYIALSYCWGSSPQYKLTSRTSETLYNEGVMLAELPQTIQDAVVVCFELGISYLWVDCLCIDQSSEEDKIRELRNMSNVYKHAVCTISAAAATDCAEGFLQTRQEVQNRVLRSSALPVLQTRESMVPVGSICLCSDTHLGFGVKNFEEEFINTRAWTYQEAWLSPRLLIYGSGPPQWRCIQTSAEYGNTNVADIVQSTFDYDEIARRTFYTSFFLKPKTLTPSDKTKLLGTWEKMICDYSKRALTYPSDKLPALSALASEFQTLLNDEYLDGIWRTSFPKSLLWHRIGSNPPQDQKTQLSEPKPSTFLQRLRKSSTRTVANETDPCTDRLIASWSPMSSQESVIFARNYMAESEQSLITIHNATAGLNIPCKPPGKTTPTMLELTGPMMWLNWPALTAFFVIVDEGSPDAYWDAIIPDDLTFFRDLSKKHTPTFNPQETIPNKLTTAFYADPRDDPAHRSAATHPPRSHPPPARQPLPELRDCNPTDQEDERKLVQKLAKKSKPKSKWAVPHPRTVDPWLNRFPNSAPTDRTGREFWLLEVIHTNTPSGIVLNRVRDNIFVRIGYFRMGRNNSPVMRIVNGHMVAGPRQWDYEADLEMRRIFLI